MAIPFWVMPFYENDTEGENRNLFPFNRISGFNTLNKYIQDNHAFRDQMSKVCSFVYVNIFKESPISEVIIGKEGWLFLGNSPNYGIFPAFDYAIGTYHVDNRIYSENICNNLSQMQSFCDSLGIKFYVAVAPSKERFYPEYLNLTPNKATRLHEQVIADLRNIYRINTIDLGVNLLNAKKKYPIYYKQDTHWNKYGGLIASETLADSIKKDYKIIDKRYYSVEKTLPIMESDLAKIIRVKDLDTDYKLMLNNSPLVEIISKEDFSSSNFKRKNESCNNTLKGIVLHDSFFEAMSNPFIQNFNEVRFVRSCIFNRSYISTIHASEKIDFIVFEKLDRNLLEIKTE